MKLAIFGCGGLGREIAQWAQDAKIRDIVFVVDEGFAKDSEVDGIQVLIFSEVKISEYEWLIGIGSPIEKLNTVKRFSSGTKFATLIHPSTRVGRSSQVGDGSIVAPGAGLSVNVKVGSHVLVSARSTVAHDSEIGDFVTVSPHVAILGNCKIGTGCFVGANACFKEGVTVADNTLVGMGSVVINSLEAGVYVGNPARRIK